MKKRSTWRHPNNLTLNHRKESRQGNGGLNNTLETQITRVHLHFSSPSRKKDVSCIFVGLGPGDPEDDNE